jgi:hypothetical protein
LWSSYEVAKPHNEIHLSLVITAAKSASDLEDCALFFQSVKPHDVCHVLNHDEDAQIEVWTQKTDKNQRLSQSAFS